MAQIDKRTTGLVEEMAREVRRTARPPIALMCLTYGFALLLSGLAKPIQHTNSRDLVFACGLAVGLLPIVAAPVFAHLFRKWGRCGVARIMARALEADDDTLVRCWSTATRGLDQPALLVIQPTVYRSLQSALPSMPEVPFLAGLLGHETYRCWNDLEKSAVCLAMLKYLARYGTRTQYQMLKRGTGGFGYKEVFRGLVSSATLGEREAIISEWESRLKA